MPNYVQPQVVINYISQRKKICVNRNNQPTQLLIQTDYYLNQTYNFQIINAINQIVQFDNETTYEVYGSYIDARKQIHILFYTPNYVIKNNILSFTINTFTSQYLAYVKSRNTKIEISIVAKKGNSSYLILRDTALANPRAYLEGQAPTDIVYQNIFNANVPVSGSFGAGIGIDLAQDPEGQEIASFAFGEGLTTNDNNQFVIGQYNTPDATKVFIIGNGTSSLSTSNLFSIDEDGNVETVGTISASTIYINGQEITESVDSKVDALSTTFDGKLESTSGWANETFETIDNVTAIESGLNDRIDTLSTTSDEKFELKTDATNKFETLTGQTNYLSGIIDQNISDIGDLNTAVASKANQTDLEALSGTVEGLAETKADLSSVYTKEEVYTYIETDVKINEATSGKANQSTVDSLSTNLSAAITGIVDTLSTKADVSAIPTGNAQLQNTANYITSAQIPTSYVQQTDLVDYAKTSDVTSAINAATSGKADASAIPTKVSELTNDVPYLSAITSADIPTSFVQVDQISDFITSSDIPVYTGASGIAIDENHVVSITGQVGKEYEAGTGLALSSDNKTFYLTGSVLQGDNTTIQIVNNTISYIGGGGGGEGTKTYTGVSGIFVNNTTNPGQISLTATIPTTVAELSDSSSYALKTDIPSDYTTSGQASAIVTGYVNSVSSDIRSGLVTTGEISDMATQTWVGQQNFVTTSQLPTDYVTSAQVSAIVTGYNYITGYNEGTGIKIENGTISVTGDIGGGKEYSAGEGLALSGQGLSTFVLTAEIPSVEGLASEGYVTSAIDNLSGVIDTDYAKKSDITNFITSSDLDDYVTDQQLEEAGFATTGALNTASTTIVNSLTAYATSSWVDTNYAKKGEAPTDVYTKSEVDDKVSAASGAAVTTATGWVNGKNFISGITLSAYNASTMQMEANDTSAIILPSSDFVTWNGAIYVNENKFAKTSDIPDVSNYATTDTVIAASANAVNVATGWVNDKNFLTAHQDLTNYATKTDVSSDIASATGVVTSWVDNKGYLTAHQSLDGYATQTWVEEQGYLTAHQDLSNYAQVSAIPTKVSQLQNDIQFITEASVTGYATTGYVDEKIAQIVVPTDTATTGWVNTQIASATGVVTSWVNDQNYLTAHQDLSNYALSANVDTSIAAATGVVTSWVDDQNYLTAHQSLDNYATTGAVNDIATGLAELSTNVGEEFTATSTYINTASGNLHNEIAAVINTIPDVSNFITSSEANEIASEAITGYIETSGLTDGTGITIANDNSINLNLSAQANIAISADNNGVVWLSATQGGSTYTAGEGLTLNGNEFSLTAQIPTSASQLANDVGYLTGITSAQVTGALGFTPVSTDTTYTAGTGLELDGTEFSLTAEIPSIEGLASEQYVNTVSGNLHNEITAAIDTATGAIPTNVSVFNNDAGYITSYVNTTYTDGNLISISGENNSINFTGIIPTVPTKVSELTNDANYATSSYVDEVSANIVTGQIEPISGKVDTLAAASGNWLDEDDLADYALKTDVPTATVNTLTGNVEFLSGAIDYVSGIVEAIDIPDVSDFIDIAAASGAASAVITGTNIVSGIVSGVASTYIEDYITTSGLTDGTGISINANNEITLNLSADANSNMVVSADNQGVVWLSSTAQGGGGDGKYYDAGTGIIVDNTTTTGTISIDTSWFGTNVSSLVSADIDAAASTAVENYIELSGIATGTGLSYDSSDRSLNVNISAATNGNIDVSVDENGVILLSAGGSTYQAGTGISIQSDTIAVTGMATTGDVNYISGVVSTLPGQIEYVSGWVSGMPSGGYTAGSGITINNGVVSVAGGGSADPTNIQTISSGFTYSSGLQIAKNTYNTSNNVITLSAFEVPAGSLSANQVATFEEWVYVNGPLTGFDFNGITLVNQIPTGISDDNYYIFTRRIFGTGEQFVKFEYGIFNQNQPLKLVGKSASNAVKLKKNGSIPTITLQYSKNGGEWTDYTLNTAIELNQNEYVKFSGANDSYVGSNAEGYRFEMTGTFEAKGTPQSLYNNTTTQGGFYSLFSGCSQLIDVSKIYLPAMNLPNYCYSRMFQDCSNIKTPPALPATGLSDRCYWNMFSNCTSLTATPVLPATEVKDWCYRFMFYGCENLQKINFTILPAVDAANGILYYQGMFQNCSKITDAPQICLSANFITAGNYMQYMFAGCTSLTSINVNFTDWLWASNTGDWVSGVAPTGIFYKPAALQATSGTSYIPSGWTVVNK